MMQTENLEQARQRHRLELWQDSTEIIIGSEQGLPWTFDQLAAIDGSEPFVRQKLDSGLTAFVYQLEFDGKYYALKQARPRCLVQNVDGQTSYLNEILCRQQIESIRAEHPDSFAAITRTYAASLRKGVMLTEWIEGEPIREWDQRKLEQVFMAGAELLLAGLFEWDYCAGNLLDDGKNLRLFDFGYTYPFDPLCHFNSAGNGDDVPMFHLAERFETRNYFGYLLGIEQKQGLGAALAAFRLEKEVALQAYLGLQQTLHHRGANTNVINWYAGYIAQWSTALRGDLHRLYLYEGWRSHVLDLDDDLRGQTCTPMTLQRSAWILTALQQHFEELKSMGAFFWHDVGRSREQLIDDYRGRHQLAEQYQISAKAEMLSPAVAASAL